jgi:hypothetical protein
MTDLEQLAKRVGEAKGADRELDADLMVALCGARRVDDYSFYGPNEEHWSFGENEDESTAWNGPLPYLTASLDRALALVEAKLPGWSWGVSGATKPLCDALLYEPSMRGFKQKVKASAATPPLALLSALLSALQAQSQRVEG